MKVKKLLTIFVLIVIMSVLYGCSGKIEDTQIQDGMQTESTEQTGILEDVPPSTILIEKPLYKESEEVTDSVEALDTSKEASAESTKQEASQPQAPVFEMITDEAGGAISYGDEVQFLCYKRKICDGWTDMGEVTFEAINTDTVFRHDFFNVSKSEITENVKEVLGKKVGEYFILEFDRIEEHSLLDRDVELYTILEIKKNTEYGNEKDTVEYGDTVRAMHRRAINVNMDWDEELVGDFVLHMNEATTKFTDDTYGFEENTVKDVMQKFWRATAGDYVYANSYDTEYFYQIITNRINNTRHPRYEFPEGWNYQFAAPEIGSFKGYEDGEAGATDMENGDVYGFEDWLALGCSTWCGCYNFHSEAKASSTLPKQGNVSYDARNLSVDTRESVWAEGVPGDGVGETIEISQLYQGTGDDVFSYNQICIVNGYAESPKKWQENNRVKSLKFYFEDEYMGMIILEDTMKPQYVDVSPVKMTVGNGCEAKFRFEIAEVYKGTLYDDTCITGIVLEFDGRYAH